jgi:hypothetical protein
MTPEITGREIFSEKAEGEGTVTIFRTDNNESWKHTTRD